MLEKTPASPAPKKPEGAAPNKMECVKKALEALGYEARPVDIRDHIKKTFNVEMSTDHISANKSTILKKRAKLGLGTTAPTTGTTPVTTDTVAPPPKMISKPAPKKKVKRKPTAKVAPAAPPVVKPAPVAAKAGDLNLLLEVQTVKGLVDRLGMENLKTLISFVAK